MSEIVINALGASDVCFQVLVLGGDGFLGTMVCEAAILQGILVVSLSW